MRAGFDQVEARDRRPAPSRACSTSSTRRREIYTAADDSFLAEMIELAGGDPITTGSTDELRDPARDADRRRIRELILLGDAAYGVTAEAVAARPGWDVMTAVKDGRHPAGRRPHRHPARSAAGRRPARAGLGDPSGCGHPVGRRSRRSP